MIRTLKVEETKVRCGEIYSDRSDHDREAKHISIHPAFNSKNLYYDFALVHVDEDFKLGEDIGLMCLPDQFEPLPAYRDDECYVMGYGKDAFGRCTLKIIMICKMISKRLTTIPFRL